jgi:Uma2 family endonuclease
LRDIKAKENIIEEIPNLLRGFSMATTTVSIEEYLSTAYEPDMDYVDGELEERNVGEYEHNVVQKRILFWFDRRAKEWRIRAIQEQRTRLGASRVRIPDVSVFSRELPIEQVFTRPQMIAIEVLSPEDRHSRMDKKIRNYLDFGVPHVWIVDPATRTGWDCSDGNWVRKERFEVAASPIYLSLPELFAELDEAEK